MPILENETPATVGRVGSATSATSAFRLRHMQYEPMPGRESAPAHVDEASVPAVTDDMPSRAVRQRVGQVLALVLEAHDGRRPLSQLDAVMSPRAARYLRAATGTRHPARMSRLRTMRICQPAAHIAEVAAVVLIAGRFRALAARFERPTGSWCCTELRLL